MDTIQKVLVRMQVEKKTEQKWYEKGPNGEDQKQTTIEMFVPYCSDPNDPQYPYARLSSGARFPLVTINQHAADMFKLGKHYMIEITPAD